MNCNITSKKAQQRGISINIYLTKIISFSKNGLASFILLRGGGCAVGVHIYHRFGS